MLLNDFEKDRALFHKDPVAYEVESQRRYYIMETKCKEFMGAKFQTPPLETEEELQENIKNKVSRLNVLREMNAPEILLEDAQKNLEDLLMLHRTKAFIMTNAEISYREQYENRYQEWLDEVRTNYATWVELEIEDQK